MFIDTGLSFFEKEDLNIEQINFILNLKSEEAYNFSLIFEVDFKDCFIEKIFENFEFPENNVFILNETHKIQSEYFLKEKQEKNIVKHYKKISNKTKYWR